MPRSGVEDFNEIKNLTISLIAPHSRTTIPTLGEFRILAYSPKHYLILISSDLCSPVEKKIF